MVKQKINGNMLVFFSEVTHAFHKSEKCISGIATHWKDSLLTQYKSRERKIALVYQLYNDELKRDSKNDIVKRKRYLVHLMGVQ